LNKSYIVGSHGVAVEGRSVPWKLIARNEFREGLRC
jgi:hypothetical protein